VKQAALVLLVVMSWTTAVRAGPGHPIIDHYQVGKRLFEQKRYAQALEEFRQALALAPRPEALYSMAQTQRLLGDCASAIETYHAFLAARPDEPLAGYARANIERCERESPSAGHAVEPGQPGRPGRPAWYRDLVGDALVGGGVIAGVVGGVIWHSGRASAMRLADAPDYQSFLARQSAASSALTEQSLGIAAMIAGGAAIVGGVVHYVRRARSSRRESSIGVVLTSGGAVIAGRGRF
jgi:tetratricopeptide (TPR) repeat protein